MFLNYLKSAYRSILKSKTSSLINSLGLTMGMTACLLILHYVHFERSYDQFHDNHERIYRLRYERESEDGSAVRFASCCPPAGALIRERYPQVEKLARIFKTQATVSYQDNKYYEDRLFFADPEFFEIFNFNFISGDPLKSLAEPGNAFVSASTARKYFGHTDPVGRIISLDRTTDYHIVGVFEDVPGNSHIKFDFLFPLKNIEAQYGDEYMLAWGHTGMYTYILLENHVTPEQLEDEFPALVSEQCPWLKEYKMDIFLKMQPLTDIHLNSRFMQEYEAGGNRNAVRYLFVIALFIIVMAWVNYINLSTARALYRAKEVGLRKVVGATRGNLIFQFFIETVGLNLFAMGLTFLLLEFLQLPFHQLTGMPIDLSVWNEVWFWPWAGLLLCAGILLSGLYPILYMTSFRITTVLKGRIRQGVLLRKTLVIFQFIMALILLVSTFTIYRQLDYMRKQDLGFDMEQILVFKTPRIRSTSPEESFKNFREVLLNQTRAVNACHITEVPGRQIYWDAGAIKKMGEADSKGKNYQIVGIDYHFTDVFDLEFVAGRSFSQEFTTEATNLILNETAVSWMGFENAESAVGQKVDYWDQIFTIVGVMKNFHQQSLREAFEPHIYRYMPTGRGTRGQFAVKLRTESIQKTIEEISRLYAEFFPGNPFDFFFLDTYYNEQYKSDELFGKVFQLFSSLTIFITALGLFGISSFSVTQRTREIGIRKVLGSSVAGIILLLSKEYGKWILISLLFAWPVAWYAMNAWLHNFAYHCNLGVPAFVASLALTVGVTMIAVGFQTMKAALINPVESIRNE